MKLIFAQAINLLLVMLLFVVSHLSAETADLVLRRGKIYTVDSARSRAESIAVKSGRIVYVGSDAGISGWIGEKTKTIDLSGRFVMPGFIDSHIHAVEGGIGMTRCDLLSSETREEALKTIKAYVESHPYDPWILGNGWALPLFPDANPRKEWLDAIVKDRPVFLMAADGHSAWVNSKALEIAGVNASTPDPENGRIERNKNGEPCGTLREKAAEMVYRHAPQPKVEETVAGLEEALKQLNRYGITAFQDASVSEKGDIPDARGSSDAYVLAEKRGVLTARVTAAIYASPSGTLHEVLKQITRIKKIRDESNSRYFRATAVKIYADGVIEAYTAALLQPYMNQDSGDLVWQPEKLNPFVELLDKEGFQIHIHAIGDRAIRVALTALEAAREINGIRDSRHLMAHLELIDRKDIPRFAQLSVIPVFQPLWAYEDSYITDLTVPKLGKERTARLYPIRSVADTRAALAMGSDWPVSSANPLDGIEVAVTRRGPDEKGEGPVFIPEERIDLATALAAYTIGSAHANFLDQETGSLETGKAADLIVLSNDLFEVPPDQINETKVLLTLLEGKEVYRDPDWK